MGLQEHRSSTDNYLGDPTIGIPTVMPHGGYGVLAHHNSHDTPATVDPKSLRDMMVMNAAYTYFLASAGPAEKRWLAEVALTRGYDQVARRPPKSFSIRSRSPIAPISSAACCTRAGSRSITRLDRESQAVQSAADLKEGLAGLNGVRRAAEGASGARDPERAAALGLGAIQPVMPPRNPGRKRSWSAASAWVRSRWTISLGNNAKTGLLLRSGACPSPRLYWCDGKRNLAEVIRLTELEMGPQDFDFVGYFNFLERHGYVAFVQGK